MALVALAWWWAAQGPARLSPARVLPWSFMFQDARQIQVVFADPDISTIQELTGSSISLSDYANQRYVPNLESLDVGMQRALRSLRGVNVPAVDVGIALSLTRLAGASSARLKTHRARGLKLGDLKTDDEFIIVGSPRSNPWGALFQDKLDFHFVYDETLKQEVIRNRRVQPGESESYLPTAKGWGTGRAFAIVALVGNPSQNGRVLLLAGTTAEGTEAAGKLVTNLPALSQLLREHGIDPAGPLRYFEALLEVRTMAGSANSFEVRALHLLPNAPPR